MHNAVMFTLSLYDVIGATRHLHIKLKSFSNNAQPLHKKAVRGCIFLYIIAKKSVIMIEAFLVDASILSRSFLPWLSTHSFQLIFDLRHLPQRVDSFAQCLEHCLIPVGYGFDSQPGFGTFAATPIHIVK